MSRNLLVLLFTGIIYHAAAQTLTAIQKAPASAMPGSEFTVEVTINKGTMTGFMKYFQPLPEGYSAANVESKNGSFTFADGGVKIVWLAPPSEPSFTISYKVMSPPSASGAQPLTAKISYIEENERKFLDLDPITVMIGAGQPEPVKSTVPVVKNEPPAEKPKETPPPPPPVKNENPPAENPPVKKETTVPVIPPSNKIPVTAAAESGKTYRVQIGAFAQKPTLPGVPDLSTVVLENGITKYFSGHFATYEEAVKRKQEMVAKGFEGAFIVSFENGKLIR